MQISMQFTESEILELVSQKADHSLDVLSDDFEITTRFNRSYSHDVTVTYSEKTREPEPDLILPVPLEGTKVSAE